MKVKGKLKTMTSYLTLPMLLIFTGSAIAVVGAALAAIDQTKSDRELRNLATENVRLTTGGDSFPVAMYMPPIEEINDPNVLTVAILVEGKYPLLDVQFEHLDVTEPFPEKLANVVEWNQTLAAEWKQWLEKRNLPLPGGTIHPKILVQRGLVHFRPEDNYKKLKLTTYARNGQFVQNTELKRAKNGLWEQHYKVFKVSESPQGEAVQLLKEQ